MNRNICPEHYFLPSQVSDRDLPGPAIVEPPTEDMPTLDVPADPTLRPMPTTSHVEQITDPLDVTDYNISFCTQYIRVIYY